MFSCEFRLRIVQMALDVFELLPRLFASYMMAICERIT